MRLRSMALARWPKLGFWPRGANDDRRQPPLDGSTAVQRMARQFPDLLPLSADAVDFAAWAAHHKADIDAAGNPVSGDDLHDLYLDICELAGWDEPLLAIAAPAPLATPENPVGAALAKPSAAPTARAKPEPALMIVTANGRRPALEASVAAARFLASMSAGAYVHSDLTNRYLEHAASIGHEPTPENTMREELAKLPGVSREVRTTAMRQHGGNRKERRLRSTYWIIKTQETAAATSAAKERFPATDEVRQSRAA